MKDDMMDERETCPNGHNLIGDPIPEAFRHHYGATHFRREIGVEIQGVYDGVLYYVCPDCGVAWVRFTEGKLYEIGKRYVQKVNKGLDKAS